MKRKEGVGAVSAFRYELDPNEAQAVLFAKGSGIRRATWNWGLGDRIRLMRAYPVGDPRRYTSAEEQHRRWNASKETERPWCYEVSKYAGQEALRDLDRAFKRLYDGRSGKGPVSGFPNFQAKGRDERFRIASCGLSEKSLHIEGRHIILPRIGAVRLKERPDTEKKRERGKHFQGRILSATIRRKADRWFVSINVSLDKTVPARPVERIAGVDLGLKTFAVVGTLGSEEAPVSIEAPRPLRAALGKLRRIQRKVARRDTWELSKKRSRKQKRRDGQQNRSKAVRQVARAHVRVANVRKDFLQKTTTTLALKFDLVCIEDLSVKWMLKNERLARQASDLGFYEFRRQLAYKQALRGFRLVVAPRHFPSTQRCSGCGHVRVGDQKLTLKDRTYVCGECGLVLDRDENASLNLAWYGSEVAAGRITTPSDRQLAGDDKLACLEEQPLPTGPPSDPASRPRRPRKLVASATKAQRPARRRVDDAHVEA